MSREYIAYYRRLPGTTPDDFPAERFEHLPPAVQAGMVELWLPIHMRRKLCELDPSDRRAFERTLREDAAVWREMADTMVNAENRAQALAAGQTLLRLHHLSVTADQAELCAAAFVR